MVRVRIVIDGRVLEVDNGISLLEAAREAGIYIPSLCYHPDLPPYDSVEASSVVYRGGEAYNGSLGKPEGCGLCVVEIEGEGLVKACNYIIDREIKVYTDSPSAVEYRKKSLMRIMANHPHYCITCQNREGCSITLCSQNVPELERCCQLLHRCELVKLCDYIGLPPDTPRYVYKALPIDNVEPRIIWDYNLCIGCLRCVRACKHLAGVEAISYTVMDGDIIVGLRMETREDSGCRFCLYCVSVCPTGALRDKSAEWVDREDLLVPCKYSCPARVDIPRYVRYLAEGRVGDALVVLRRSLPFPAILGRVCHHPCEDACNRGDVNDAISIKGVKRFIAEYGDDDSLIDKLRTLIKSNGKSVAVVGSGPSGLSAAYFLRLLGYRVVVYEEGDEPGGLMRVYPEYRLPSSILDREIDKICRLGVELRLGVKVGRDISLGELRRDFDAVLLAVGMPKSKVLGWEGVELKNIFPSIEFLRKVKKGIIRDMGGRVVVIGGGNVAFDAARTCIRLGGDVSLVCLESYDEMPAHRWEVEDAVEEGVKIFNSWGPRRFIGEDGRVRRVEFIKCVSVFDEEGRFNPRFDETITMELDADYVIIAIGQEPDLTGLEDILSQGKRYIDRDEESLMTRIDGIFVCGDVVKGTTSVVEAVAEGYRAAISINRYLGGEDILDKLFDIGFEDDLYLGKIEGFAGLRRVDEPRLGLDRRRGFEEVILGYDYESAVREAVRCLRCDLRLYISKPIYPPEPWIPLDMEHIKEVPEEEGVIQLLDDNKDIIYIKGVENLREALLEKMSSIPDARFFMYEVEKMYTVRESELLQQYTLKHGRMPKYNLDEFGGEDLFYD
jgi:NADPH-dependent glutamate synthase beta subunit-like oxidoreductase